MPKGQGLFGADLWIKYFNAKKQILIKAMRKIGLLE